MTNLDLQGITAASELDLTLYDYRAAVWTKLDNLQNALKDGRRMIKAAKTDPRVSPNLL